MVAVVVVKEVLVLMEHKLAFQPRQAMAVRLL
jgi:hypothetical protein